MLTHSGGDGSGYGFEVSLAPRHTYFSGRAHMQEFAGARFAGKGSAGYVFIVSHGGGFRALKLLVGEEDTQASVMTTAADESRILSGLRHPCIIRTYGEIITPLSDSLVTLLPTDLQV